MPSNFTLSTLTPYTSNRRRTISVAAMEADKLRRYMEESRHGIDASVLVIDCRPFISFNESHITSAVNIYCPTIVRRRTRNKPSLDNILPSNDVSDRIREGKFHAVVLYGQAGENFSSEPSSKLVLSCLCKEVKIRRLFYLTGGFEVFYSKFPHLCVGGGPPTSFPAIPTQREDSLFTRGTRDQGEPVEILPHLFLGSEGQAANLTVLLRLGITALVNVSPAVSLRHPPLLYKCIPVEDTNSEEIGIWFHEAIDFIDDVKRSGGKALIHCPAGISRSATICLAYVMHSNQLRLEDAFDFVKARRHVISPNFNFMGQLLNFESQVFTNKSELPDLPDLP